MPRISDYLSWFANFTSFLLIVYLFIHSYKSSCFSAYEMGLSVGSLILSVFAQSFALFFKNFNQEVV